MIRDTSFRPRLGRIGVGSASKKDANYLKKLAKEISGFGHRRGVGKSGSHRTSSNSRGRGAGLQGKPRSFSRRVLVKARFVKLASADGMGKARAHLRYIQRDGAGLDGDKGRLFSAEHHVADGDEFLKRGEGDRHQFRFIVSPEDGQDINNLEGFTRSLMKQMEHDLGTKLDWVAVTHHNTDHPHVHVMLRGATDTGQDLVIDRDYMSRGFRARAEELVTLELGPRTIEDIARQLDKEISANRYTGLDRTIEKLVIGSRIDLSNDPSEATDSNLRLLARVRHLETLGLAEPVKGGNHGVYALKQEFGTALRQLGLRGDIVKTMQQALGKDRTQFAIYEPNPTTLPVIGRVTAKGLADEHTDRKFIVVDGLDGRGHYVDVGHHPAFFDIKIGTIVEVGGAPVSSGKADQTIAAIAKENGGVYTAQAHEAVLRRDMPKLPDHRREEMVASHVRRLGTLEKGGHVSPISPTAWTVPVDLPDRVDAQARAAAQDKAAERKSVPLRVLSETPLEQQVSAQGATWLDRHLEDGRESLSSIGFGADVRTALQERAEAHLAEGRAERNQRGEIVVRRNIARVLMMEEIERVGTAIARDSGRAFITAKDGAEIKGVYTKKLSLVSGKFAQIESPHAIALVPWKPSMERQLGQPMAGVMRGSSVAWTDHTPTLPTM
jgi:type IV secretory pathway VirD2 relaxase